MNEKWNLRFLLIALVFLATVLGGGFAVLATAQTADVELANETVLISNDTDTVYAEIGNTTENSTVTFYGIDENGNETETYSENVSSVADGNTVLVEETANSDLYDEYRVIVMGNESDVGSATVTVGTFEKTTGGAGGTDDGGLLSDWSNAQLFALLVIFAAAVAVAKGD